ncbi:MAG TPA: hypothetical protein VIH35_00180, partial [Kiritimatiellia bacterium]
TGWTIIRAANDGAAVILSNYVYFGGAVNGGVATGSSHIQVEGLKLLRSTITSRRSHHIKVLRTGIKNGVPPESRYGTVVSIQENSHHILLEDVWVVGAMRYGILVYESEKVVLRRVVTRYDGNTEREPKAGVSFYGATEGIAGASNSVCQNCIALDFNPGSDAGLYVPHSGRNIKFVGSLSLNVPANGISFNEDTECRDQDVINSVVWDCSSGLVMGDGGPAATTRIEQVTAAASTRGLAQFPGSGQTNPYTVVKNCMFISNSLANTGADVSSYNHYFPGSQAQGSFTTTNNPLLQYILRTSDAGTGENGARRGATVEYRVGAPGTLWDEPGYDEATTERLWPWPNEDRIHDDAAAADGFSYPSTNWNGAPYTVTNFTDRGFAAPGMTLTRYIWEYLGAACPRDVCDPIDCSLSLESNGIAVTFTTATGRHYDIQQRTSGAWTGGWQEVVEGLAGAGGALSHVLTNPASLSVYRVVETNAP